MTQPTAIQGSGLIYPDHAFSAACNNYVANGTILVDSIRVFGGMPVPVAKVYLDSLRAMHDALQALIDAAGAEGMVH